MSKAAASHVIRTPFRWTGAKTRLVDWVVPVLDQVPHTLYCEPFCGTCIVGLSKRRALLEVYNDADSDISRLFRVLRDPVASEQLRRAVALTPYHRDEYTAAQQPVALDACDVDRVRQWLVRMTFSHSTKTEGSSGFDTRVNRDYYLSRVNFWRDWPAHIAATIKRMMPIKGGQVLVENTDYRQIIVQHDSPKTLFYCDPPYHRPGGAIKGYAQPWSGDDHVELAGLLKSCSAAVVLSGYPSDLYSDLFGDWTRLSHPSYTDGGRARTECLWLNEAAQAAQRQRNLFT